MKKRIAAIFLVCAMMLSAMFLSGCQKTPKGKEGFFTAESNIGTMLSDIAGSQIKMDTATGKKGVKTSSELVLKSLPMQEMTGMEDLLPIKIGMESTLKLSDEKMNARVYAEAFGERVAASLYLGKNELYISLEELLSKAIKIDAEKYNLNLKDANEILQDLQKLPEIFEKYKGVIKDEISDENITDGKDNITIDGKVREASTITLKLDAAAIKSVYTKALNTAKEDGELLDLIVKYKNFAYQDMTEEELEILGIRKATKDDIIADIDREIAELSVDEKAALTWTRTIYQKQAVAEYVKLEGDDGYSLINYFYYEGKKTSEGKFSVKHHKEKEDADDGSMGSAEAGIGFLNSDVTIDYRLDKGDENVHKLIFKVDDKAVLTFNNKETKNKNETVCNIALDIHQIELQDQTITATVEGKLAVKQDSDTKQSYVFDGKAIISNMVAEFELSGSSEASDDIEPASLDISDGVYDIENETDASSAMIELMGNIQEKAPKLYAFISNLIPQTPDMEDAPYEGDESEDWYEDDQDSDEFSDGFDF